MSSYHRMRQLKAAKHRLIDANEILTRSRFTAAKYLGGYAIECGLKSLICFIERKQDFQETQAFLSGLQGSRLHNLTLLFSHTPQLQHAIALEGTGELKASWAIVIKNWDTNELRYSEQNGDITSATSFLLAVKKINSVIMSLQNENT